MQHIGVKRNRKGERMQTTLGMRFENLKRKSIEFVEHLSDEHELVIAYPSFTTDLTHYCHYQLQNGCQDYCSCPGDTNKNYNCWHTRIRGLAIKLFINRTPKKDFMEYFELFDPFELDEVCMYIIQLMRKKGAISAKDLNHITIPRATRRIIGSAFIRLKRQNIITYAGYDHGDSKINAMYMKKWKLRDDAPNYKLAMRAIKV